MNINEFSQYLKDSKIVESWNEVERRRMNYFLMCVSEIERLDLEMGNGISPPYLKMFMLPEDYVRILRDLKNKRISKFYKLMEEKKKYLSMLELSKEEEAKILNKYEKELAKSLNLKLYHSREKLHIK